MTKVILVDEKDKKIGLMEKFEAHKAPAKLHRAISIVIFNNDKTKTLITQRSIKKPTWPLFWSNAVCSHPLPSETYKQAAQRRIFEEAGFKTPLKEVFHFTYEAEMNDHIWGEHEIDHVFEGVYEGPVNPNPEEITDYEWISLSDLKKEFEINPRKFTPWFKTIFERIYNTKK